MNLRLRLNKADSPARPSHARRNSYGPVHTAELHYLCLHPVAKRFRRLAQAAASRPPCTSPSSPSPFAAVLIVHSPRQLRERSLRRTSSGLEHSFANPFGALGESAWRYRKGSLCGPHSAPLGWCAESCLAMSGGERGGLEGGCDEGAWLEPLCVFALSFVVVSRRECRAGLAREERYPVCC